MGVTAGRGGGGGGGGGKELHVQYMATVYTCLGGGRGERKGNTMGG